MLLKVTGASINIGVGEFSCNGNMSLQLTDGHELEVSMINPIGDYDCTPEYGVAKDLSTFVKCAGFDPKNIVITAVYDTDTDYDPDTEEAPEPETEILSFKSIETEATPRQNQPRSFEKIATEMTGFIFERYISSGGKIKTKAEFAKHLTIFFMLTLDSFTGGPSIGRDNAANAWIAYMKGCGYDRNEANLIFCKVDEFSAYT